MPRPRSNPLLLPRENGKPMDRHAVTRYLNKAAEAAGIGHRPIPTKASMTARTGRRPGPLCLAS
jgi:hypothetical protein